jgi:Domain of unknown function (DUF397)
MAWRKSTYPDANAGACGETASDSGNCIVLVRDTTNRDGVTLDVPVAAGREFTASLR